MSAYLSARAAAVRLGVSDKTVRTWVRQGRLEAAPSATGFRIPVEAVEDLAAERAADTPHPSATSAPDADHTATLRAYVADLRTQLEVKDCQISELHTLLAQAQHALPAPQSMDSHLVGPSANGASESASRHWWQFWTR